MSRFHSLRIPLKRQRHIFASLVAMQDSLLVLNELSVHKSRERICEYFFIDAAQLESVTRRGICDGWLDKIDEQKEADAVMRNGEAKDGHAGLRA